MKNLLLLAASALLASPAASVTWVRYDIQGSGSYFESECCDDDGMTLYENGYLEFRISAFVEVDPSIDDFSAGFTYGSDGQYYSGENRDSLGTWNDAAASNDELSLHTYRDEDRNTLDLVIKLVFPHGSFGDALPDTFLKNFRYGTFDLEAGSHYTGLSGSGRIDSATATIVSKPEPWVPQYVAVPWVPEPASWAMMLAGFGFAGMALRVQRRGQTHNRGA